MQFIDINLYLGDNCIVFENFTASIGDLMVANWVYWRCALAEPVNGYLLPLNRQLMLWNYLIQYSYLHSNVIMYRCVLSHYWQDDVSGNQLKF
jgi:hypothetical protein